ncbi:MAG: GNAT family N-acetyltransferase [Candidatus Marinimicrobia bacterium]|nr:GNAT family N-acetyltransferase [Candidatus Neomarinimicrobiota bacterium]MCF7850725.1 GNAT family N-acetyltransferase [Candidatus Neomarinimicrobiota bacterium]
MTIDVQPTLVGELCNLRPLRREDYAAVWKIASDPRVWEQHPAWDRYQEPIFKKLFEESMDSSGCLVIRDNETDEIIGSSRYWGHDEALSEIEIGWTFIAPKYWGGAYNREIKQLMLSHIFQFVDRVIFKVGVKNFRSQRAMEKIGGRQAGLSEDTGGNASFVYESLKQDFDIRGQKRSQQ